MKREFLKNLGLTDEQIDKIMAENGKDIEKAKGDTAKLESDLEAKKTEVETLQGQLKEANKQIEGFKGMDIEGIKKAADDYKQKFEQAEKDAQAKLEKLQFDHALENALRAAKAKNTKAVKALIDLEGLKFNGEEIIGLKDQLEKIQKENAYLFEDAKGVPKIVLPGNGGGGGKDDDNSIGKRLAEQAKQAGALESKENPYFK